MPAVARKDERMELRLSSSDKKLLVEAASLRGMKPTEFVLKVVIKASRKAVDRVKAIQLSRRDQIAMIDALLEPPTANTRLRKARAKHDEMTGRAR